MTDNLFCGFTSFGSEAFPFTHSHSFFLPLDRFPNLLLVHSGDGKLSLSLLTLVIYFFEVEATLIGWIYLSRDNHSSVHFLADPNWSSPSSSLEFTLSVRGLLEFGVPREHQSLVLNIDDGARALLWLAVFVLLICFVGYFYGWFYYFWSNLVLRRMGSIFWTWRLYILGFVNWPSASPFTCLVCLTTSLDKLLESFFSRHSQSGFPLNLHDSLAFSNLGSIFFLRLSINNLFLRKFSSSRFGGST